MKKILWILTMPLLVYSCKKTETPSGNSNNPQPAGCGDGMICFNMDGTDISKSGAGYDLDDSTLFVKYEEGAKQLSIDIFGKTSGTYIVTDVRKKGNGRIYYFPTLSSSDTFYMAETGKLEITAFDATSLKITGTFSGTLYKYKDGTKTFIKTDSFVVKNGTFTNVQLKKI